MDKSGDAKSGDGKLPSDNFKKTCCSQAHVIAFHFCSILGKTVRQDISLAILKNYLRFLWLTFIVVVVLLLLLLDNTKKCSETTTSDRVFMAHFLSVTLKIPLSPRDQI